MTCPLTHYPLMLMNQQFTQLQWKLIRAPMATFLHLMFFVDDFDNDKHSCFDVQTQMIKNSMLFANDEPWLTGIVQKHGHPDAAKQKLNIPNPHVNAPHDQRLIAHGCGLMRLMSTPSSGKSLDDDVSSWNVASLMC